VLTAGAFAVDPVIGSVFIEFNAAGTTVTPPPDPEPGDGVDAPPDSLPVARGILAWHIADHADNTYTSIGAGNFRVSTLADLTGNGNHLTDAGAAEGPSEPARTDSSVIATQNGRQPVNYGGNGGYSVWPTSLFTGVTEAELWIVVRAAGGDPNSHFNGIDWYEKCWTLGPGTGTARWARHDSGTADTGGISEDFGSSVTRDLGDAPGSLAGFRIYNVRAATGQWVAALDGTVFYTDTSNTVQFSTAPWMGDGGANIDICEIVLYSNILTTDERALVLAALQSRWGL
jgi:hypothetical protein